MPRGNNYHYFIFLQGRLSYSNQAIHHLLNLERPEITPLIKLETQSMSVTLRVGSQYHRPKNVSLVLRYYLLLKPPNRFAPACCTVTTTATIIVVVQYGVEKNHGYGIQIDQTMPRLTTNSAAGTIVNQSYCTHTQKPHDIPLPPSIPPLYPIMRVKRKQRTHIYTQNTHT